MRTREYASIDIAKIVFSVLIICLYVPQGNTGVIHIISTYVSRLGVPFFFIVAGFFGHKNIVRVGGQEYFRDRFKKLGKLFITWTIIYLPLTIYYKSNNNGRRSFIVFCGKNLYLPLRICGT